MHTERTWDLRTQDRRGVILWSRRLTLHFGELSILGICEDRNVKGGARELGVGQVRRWVEDTSYM
jgi:hypothetical protein